MEIIHNHWYTLAEKAFFYRKLSMERVKQCFTGTRSHNEHTTNSVLPNVIAEKNWLSRILEHVNNTIDER
jgi:cell wall assembly regulator SMI1